MNTSNIMKSFDLSGQTVVVTGGAGVLCTALCRLLASVGAKIAVLDIKPDTAENLTTEIRTGGGEAIAVICDVLDKASVELAAQQVVASFGGLDVLINGAGGNRQQATTNTDLPFFDLPVDAMRWVFDLNLMGTILPSQVFGKIMAQQKRGVILNISSMNAFRPLTRIPAYSAAKAGINNFTQWLAVHMAQEYAPEIRVNAIAPGFFRTEQNEYLLVDRQTGELTARAKAILAHSPMGRFGIPEDLFGAVLWLVSSASAFITGIVVPIDGGFSAYSGV